MVATRDRITPWWSRRGLDVRDGRLSVAGRDAETLAREHGTPLFVYDLGRIADNARRLQGALERAGLRHRVRLALKAQREPEVLAALRSLGPPGSPEAVGIDACSPGEVLHALEHGWIADEISHTGTNMSERDLDVLFAHGVHLNVDLLSQLDRVGRRRPARSVGLRVNPRIGAGYRAGDDTLYADAARPTKFGIYAEQLDEALAIADRRGVAIDTVHSHVGRGFLTNGLARFDEAMEHVAGMVGHLLDRGAPIVEINAGGGLGTPRGPGDEALDIDAFASVLTRRFGEFGLVVGVEPGDYLVKDGGILLAEVVSVEDRDGVRFVGVDAGWNLLNERFIYGVRQEVVVCARAGATPARPVTIAGHINEGDDLFAEDCELPEVREGDVISILNCGSYAQSMSIVHCLRPGAPALFL